MRPVIFLLLFSYKIVLAQTTIDSLKRVLSITTVDSEKVVLLNTISKKIRAQDLQAAYSYAMDARNLAIKTGNIKGKLWAQLNLGLAVYYKGQWDEALKIYMESLEEAERINFKPFIPQALIDIGIIYEVEQHYGEAISTYGKALKLFIELNDERGMSTSYSNLGAAYYHTLNYKKALEYYEKAKVIIEKQKSRKAMGGILNNIAGVYADMKDYKKCLEYYFLSYNLKQELLDKNGMALTAGNIGGTYREMKDYTNAIKYDNLAVQLCQEVGNNNLLQESYLDLALCYEKTNDYKSAYQLHTLYSAVKDSIFNTESAQSIAELETKFNSAEKDKELLIKDIKIKEQQGRSRQQQIIMISLIAGLGLAVLAIFFIFKSYRDKQKASLLIARQKELVEEKQKEILDSIHYAKRIQTALLPSDAYILRNLNKAKK